MTKLYLISQTKNNDWDTYDSAVVVAETPEEAVLIHPGGEGYSMKDEGDLWTWTTADNVTATEIGDAIPGITGVVCASFNAG